ncbi:pilus assembly protein PilM [Candidatus Nomurabacteria bacterium]|nr:pilus assembly protein PilM [Candidatus Nomurabacteria bacterium]
MIISERKTSLLQKFFPVPKYLTLDPFALEISPKAVRMMQMTHTKNGYTPVVYDEIILTESCSLLESEKDLSSCDELQEALVKLRDKYKMRFVNVSIPELKTYIFKITLPKEAAINIRHAIKFKLEDNVPLSPEDVIFHYYVMNQNTRGVSDDFEVTVAALPKGVIETYTELLHSLNLFPITFESESHALARSVIDRNDHDSYLLIHLGATKINLSIVEKNIVQYASSVPVGGGQVVADLTSNEAQILKEQINKLLIYWFTNEHDPSQNEKIELAIVTGEVGNSIDLVNFLERHLRLSVQVADVWRNCFSLDKYIPEISKVDSLRYGIAIGLALINKDS